MMKLKLKEVSNLHKVILRSIYTLSSEVRYVSKLRNFWILEKYVICVHRLHNITSWVSGYNHIITCINLDALKNMSIHI